ncbi:tetratricopeptide repeat protein [Murinocardiopsis flavida]|uniref:Tetratricopeptide repeat protein n=1 Tax=Murinocardiopsis flavida TaxID=645275 RepID=A0A2P8DKI6_9ACTN|nr:tetratricopeptide repeat protein [Murinocardiopsis flavida]PSK97726.1 tetratricopeptide repeat protein [Murinocardiopsis flavida]
MHERQQNAAHGDVSGQVVQVGEVHGGIHLHGRGRDGTLADVSLDAPRSGTPIRGRDALLAELTGALDRPDGLVRVLHGLGGCGKTAAAQSVADHAAEHGIAVFWIRPEAALDAMLRVAVELGASFAEAERSKATPTAAQRWVWRHLHAAPHPWLLVFDNVDEPVEFCGGRRPGDGDAWIRGSRAGLTMATTRVGRPELWRPALLLEVGPLDERDSVRVLSDHAGGPDPDDLPDAVREAARRVGGIPLALRLIGGVLQEYRTGSSRYEDVLAVLGRSLRELDALAAPVLAARGDGRRPERRMLGGVWALSLDLLRPEIPQAPALLQVLSFLGADGVEVPWGRLPHSALRGGIVDTGPEELTGWSLDRAVNGLRAHGLLDVRESAGVATVALHPLVAEVTRERLGADGLAVAAAVHALVSHPGGDDLAVEQAAYRGVCAVRERELGAAHPLTLDARFGLAFSTLERRSLDEADTRFRALLRDWARAQGPEHPGVLLIRHELGRIAIQRRDWAEAEAQYRAVEAMEESGVLGWHLWTGRHGRALIAFEQGDLAAAERQLREVVRLREHARGPRDIGTMISRHELGRVSLARGNAEEAEESFRTVAEVLDDVLGPLHPQTLASRYERARAAAERGAADRAAAEFAAVAQAQRQVLGADHPGTRRTREALQELRRPRPE